MTEEGDAMDFARRAVKERAEFYYHLMVYVFVNAILVIVDLGVGDGRFLGLDWAFWPILGWGLGLAGHGISTFFGEGKVQEAYRREIDAGR